MKKFVEAYWKPVVAVLFLGAVLVMLNSYINEREERARFEAKAEVLAEQVKEHERRGQELDKRLKDVEDRAARDIEQLRLLAAKPVTVREIVKEVPAFIPGLGPVKEVAPNTLPDAPSGGIVLDEAQVQELRSFYIGCKGCEIAKQAMDAELAIEREKLETKDKIIAAKDDELKAAKQAVKGGSFWKRTKSAAKYVGIGIAVGVLLKR